MQERDFYYRVKKSDGTSSVHYARLWGRTEDFISNQMKLHNKEDNGVTISESSEAEYKKEHWSHT